MKKFINFLRGWVAFTVEGPFPERLYNLCARQGVAFWHLTRVSGNIICLRVAAKDRKRFRKAAEQAGCTVLKQENGGVPFFLWGLRKRYGFLAGLLGAAVLTLAASSFLWTVEVTGAEKVPEQVITAALRRHGVHPGAYGPGLDVRQIAQETLLELPQLSYLTVNIKGTRAEVIVREGVEKPALPDDNAYCDLYAQTDGVVKRVEILSGEALTEVGKAVLKGERLAAGMVELKPPMYSDLPSRYLTVRAEGEVWAETRRVLTAEIPLTAEGKRYTGEKKTGLALLLPGQRINFFQNSGIPYGEYDKINVTKSLPWFGAALEKTEYRAYVREERELDAQKAEAMLKNRLRELLMQQVGDGTVLSLQFKTEQRDGLLTVTLTAQCEEQIAAPGPLGDRTGAGQTDEEKEE